LPCLLRRGIAGFWKWLLSLDGSAGLDNASKFNEQGQGQEQIAAAVDELKTILLGLPGFTNYVSDSARASFEVACCRGHSQGVTCVTFPDYAASFSIGGRN
jgi:hypothetical protein